MTVATQLLLFGGLAVFVGTALRVPVAQRTGWVQAAGLAAVLGALVLAAPVLAGGPEQQAGLSAVARVDGEPAVATVVIQRQGQQRRVRQLRLERPAPTALPGVIVLALLGLFALVFREHRLAPWTPVAGALGVTALFIAAQGSGEGAAGLQAFLSGFDIENVVSMTPPAGRWTFELPHNAIPNVVAVIGLSAALVKSRPVDETKGRIIAGIGAALASVAVVVQIADLGGLYWTAAQTAVWAGAAALAIAAVDKPGWQSACLSALAIVITGATLT